MFAESMADRSTHSLKKVSADTNPDTPTTVARTNGHTVISKTPDSKPAGSADKHVCFQCVFCGETAHPHEDRVVSDSQWAANYFRYFACPASADQRAEC